LSETETVSVDWEDKSSLAKACDGCDVVIHCAGFNAGDCELDPVKALEFNGVYTARLIDSAVKANVSKFLYFSTAHVYSSPLKGLVTDNSCPENLHPYAFTHLAGEKAVLYAALNADISSAVLRITNCFGKPVHRDANCWMLLVNDLCRQAVEVKALNVKSNGTQLRDFISISKLCRDVLGILESPMAGLKTNKGIINISDGNGLSVTEMAIMVQERCSAVLGYTPDLTFNTGDIIEYDKELTIVPSSCISNLGNTDNKINEIDELLVFCSSEFG
jgi:UDP-glucose 4-epimerase